LGKSVLVLALVTLGAVGVVTVRAPEALAASTSAKPAVDMGASHSPSARATAPAVTSAPAARAAVASCPRKAKRVTTCVLPQLLNASTSVRPNAAAVVGPPECGFTSAATQPQRTDVSRFETCDWRPASFVDVGPNGESYGAQDVMVVEWFITAPSTLTIRHGLTFQALTGTGDYSSGGLSLRAPLPCQPPTVISSGETCSTTDTGLAVDTVLPVNGSYSNNWSEKVALGSSSHLLRFIINYAEMVVIHPQSPNPAARPVKDYNISGNDEWRCDDEVAGAGCVNPDFVPNAVFDSEANPLVGPVAHHIRHAQDTLAGNPGRPGSGNPLTRVSEADRVTNYNAVCGSSSSRFVPDPPTNTSCDEYPLASSSQGGNSATTSVAAVPSQANSSQGGIINGQYNALRIIVGDNFYVEVILADPRTGNVTPAAALTNQFNNYSNNAQCSDWSGGDATNSVGLPDGQRAWFFSDSYLGSPADRKTFFYTSTVHNSVVVQNGAAMRTITGGNTCQERNTNISFFDRYAKNIADAPDAAQGGFYWTGDQQLVGSNVVKFYYHGYNYANSFVNDYAAVATIPASALQSNATLTVTPTKLTCAAGGPPALWGTMTLDWTAKDGYYYIYGTASTTPHQLYLARTSTANLTNFAAWQFFASANSDGTAEWTTCGLAQPLPIGYATGGSVSYINGAVWLVQDDYVAGSLTAGEIAAHPSDTPWGFTARRIDLYNPPEGHYDYPYYYLVYEPRIQQGLSNPDGTSNVILSYNVNTASVDTGCASASTHDGSIYRPRFVEIPTSWFNTYDAPQGLLGANPIRLQANGPRSGLTAMDGRTVLQNPARDPGRLPAPSKQAAAISATDIAGITDWFEHFGQPCPTIAAPNPLTVAAQPSGAVNLAWANRGTDVWYYVYQCDSSAGTCATTSACGSNAGGYVAQFGGLWLTVTSVGFQAVTSSSQQGHRFVYYVCSSGAQNPNPIGTSGNGGATSHVAATVTVAAPRAPTNVKASRSGATFTVSWTQVTYPSTQVTYTPYYRDITAGWPTTFVLGAQPVSGVTSTKFNVPSATDKYEIYVVASNIGGSSPPSNKLQL
jgi:hypothetical protein